MKREYQPDFSDTSIKMYHVQEREQKAKTMVSVLQEHFQCSLGELSLINVGSSTGIIDNYLARYFKSIVGIDIDKKAVEHAKKNFHKNNLSFQVGDALNIDFADNSFDIVICSQVYEHVPDAHKMFEEILRVLRPGGICYFAASNRIMWNEPHYNLPLLSVLPRPLAHLYIRLAGKAEFYHELHYTYWGLKHLVKKFIVHEFTNIIISNPVKYNIDYMVQPNSMKGRVARFITHYFLWLSPGYIWLLEKPKEMN